MTVQDWIEVGKALKKAASTVDFFAIGKVEHQHFGGEERIEMSATVTVKGKTFPMRYTFWHNMGDENPEWVYNGGELRPDDKWYYRLP